MKERPKNLPELSTSSAYTQWMLYLFYNAVDISKKQTHFCCLFQADPSSFLKFASFLFRFFQFWMLSLYIIYESS